VAINIMGSSGPFAFAPNPTLAAVGDTIVWTNFDLATHNIVLDTGMVMEDGTVFTTIGEVLPGLSSVPLPPLKDLTPISYHCTIHPTMVGSINGELPVEPPPPPDDSCPDYDYCY
jgi:hypothetical protein